MSRSIVRVALALALSLVLGALPAIAADAPATGTAAPSQPPPGSPQPAGRIFGVTVPLSNYFFAKRVLMMFPHPWEEQLSPEDRERAVWEALILHFESFRRNIEVTEEELEKRINSVLKSQHQTFTRQGDPAAYAQWVKTTLNEDVELFENQMRYLYQIDKLKDSVRQSLPVPVTGEEMQEEFLNEQHHVGGEMVTFDSLEEAQVFFKRHKEPKSWERMKAKGEATVRPVSLMTLEAYMDLWGIPKEQLYAFHAMPLGSIGPPMPFGKQWCVYRLLDKRIGDLAEFTKQRDVYFRQIQMKKQYDALKRWSDELKARARLEVYPLPQDNP